MTTKLSRQYGLNLKTKLNNQTKNATSAAAASVTQHIPETSRNRNENRRKEIQINL